MTADPVRVLLSMFIEGHLTEPQMAAWLGVIWAVKEAVDSGGGKDRWGRTWDDHMRAMTYELNKLRRTLRSFRSRMLRDFGMYDHATFGLCGPDVTREERVLYESLLRELA